MHLKPHQVQLIRSLANAGFHARFIGEIVGCSISAVHTHKDCSLLDYRNGLTGFAKATVANIKSRKRRMKGVA